MNIEERLAKLERVGRTWRWIALALAVLIGVALSCGQRTQEARSEPAPVEHPFAFRPDKTIDKLRIKELEVVNDEGKAVAMLVGRKHGAILDLLNIDRSATVRLVTTAQGAGCHVSGKDNSLYVAPSMMWIERISSDERLYHKVLRARMGQGMKLSKEESGRLFRERTAVRILANEHGGGVINVYNTFGREVVSVQANKSNTGAVYVHDVNGKGVNALIGPD